MSQAIHAQDQGSSSLAPVLVVDLDGTLLKGNLLLESLLAYLFPAPWRLFPLLGFFFRGGRALLKERLAERVHVDGAVLPWNEGLLAFCRAENQRGRRVVLATASNENAARALTRHLSFISAVIGSDASHNLKGEAKAKRLVSEFGVAGFDYVGDSAADLPVWKAAAHAFFAGPAPRLPVLQKRLKKPLTGLNEGPGFEPFRYFKALRPHQWLKNILVFVPLLAAHRWSDAGAWDLTLPVFLALCCLASASYLLNDLSDLDADRRHPRKRMRPLAGGSVSLPGALAAILLLFGSGLFLASVSGPAALAVTLLYFVLTTLYSLFFKKIPVVDTVFLSGLYTYRIVLGGVAAAVFISPWLLAFSTTFFLGLAFLKRYVELDGFPGQNPALLLPGRGYSRNDLVFVLVSGISSSFLSVVVLALYLESSASSTLYRAPQWLWGIGLVMLFWIIRIWFLAGRKQMNDDPVWFAAKDPLTLGLALLCLAIVAAAGPI